MKKILFVFIFLPLLLIDQALAQLPPSLPPNQLTLPAGNYTLPLHWKGDSLRGRWEPYVALLIPVTLPGCPQTFYMQFDTGAPYSLFYGNKLQAIHRKYPATTAPGDSLTNYRFKAGPLPITARQIAIRSFDSSGIDWKNKRAPQIIGTLGADLLENKVIIIDYPRKSLFIGDSLPAHLQPTQLTSFLFAMRRILLPATIKGKNTILYFDTGSSAFELLTDKATCHKLASDSSGAVQYPVQSWGKTLTANTIATNDSITVGGLTIPVRHATWIEGVSDDQVSQMMKMGIGGMTGNKLFLSYILVLDTKSKKFGLHR
ncbi:hypothetical protein HB364_18825 [Pseudoflavitalea sp. X16]|uniref:hypothetical protein n=1 Tax=Paraflavitalea devenefica TaxID=2716334 RepID=UPI0014230FB6|nr:hypothetical protein [Paraflavitalea devenefica]NII27149.1 hypothetical protein [Paraflavitalea devenefica]